MKFAPGQRVRMKEYPGHTGDIILIEVNSPTDLKYYLDCHPGAVGHNMVYMWLQDKKYYALDVFTEDELTEV